VARLSAQDQAFTREIQARGRLFAPLGPGVTAIKRDSAGRYYVLAAPRTAVQIYSPDGSPAGQIPPNAISRSAKIVYAQDFDLDSAGRIFVADRGANAVKIFDATGSPDAPVRVTAPMSVAALTGGEFAVTALRSDKLVSIFDARGNLERGFGEPTGSAGSNGSAPFSRGRLYGDAAGHIYFAFDDKPDLTIRKYDAFGYAAYEISLPASEFKPEAEPRKWNTVTIEKGGPGPPEKPVIRALCVDPETQEVWMAIGNELLHFDRDGNRRSAYLTATKEGVRIEAVAILVEHDRILVADDPLGVFDFAYPEPRQVAPAQH